MPLSTAYSLAEAFGKVSDLTAAARADRLFYGSFVVLVGLAATIVSLPNLPLLSLIYFSQLVNAILLAPHLVLLVLLNRDAQIIGNHDIISAGWSAAAWLGIVLVVSSVLALGVGLLTTQGATLSLFLVAAFFGLAKLLRMALDLVVLWAAITNWLQPTE